MMGKDLASGFLRLRAAAEGKAPSVAFRSLSCKKRKAKTRTLDSEGSASAGLAGLAPLFAFFGGHTFPAVAHFETEARAIGAAVAHATEKDAAESQQADGLPEGDCFPAEQRRKQPIPEMHYYFAADPD